MKKEKIGKNNLFAKMSDKALEKLLDSHGILYEEEREKIYESFIKSELSNIYDYVVYVDEEKNLKLLKNINNKSKNCLTFVTAFEDYNIETFDHSYYIINTNKNNTSSKTIERIKDINVKIINCNKENVYPLAITDEKLKTSINRLISKFLHKQSFCDLPSSLSSFTDQDNVDINLYVIQLLTNQYKNFPYNKVGLNVKPYYMPAKDIYNMFNNYKKSDGMEKKRVLK